MDSFEKTIERKEDSPILNQSINNPGTMAIDTTNMVSTTPGSHQHPPPSPLSGCYLLVVLPEPHAIQHKNFILNKLAKGFLSWDKENCHVDLEKELEALVAQSPEGEEARNGERLIQYATENLVTEILIHPQTNTLLQCIRNLLASFTKHRHIIHAGYTFSENGSWILQDGTFSLADFFDAFNEHDVQRVLRAYENNVTIAISCVGIGEWSTERLSQEPSTRSCRIRLNPEDILSTRLPAITSFINYIEQYLVTQTLTQLMQPSDVVGNIRFSHPTLYVFPGGQGDAALFGINGFNMLVDGGFARKSCFWDFTRHLDRLDAVLFTRVNNSNIGGMSSFLRKKKETQVYPQIGHFFGNLFESKQLRSSDDNKDDDPLIISLIDLGQELVANLKHIHLRPHLCYRRQDPINLYHKVGHGTLDMYVLSPVKDSREVKDFLSKWTAADHKLFADSHKKDSNNFAFPIRNMVSICALIVWQPANPEDTITRILFPGSTPQHTIFEGIERLKHLEFLKHSTCSAKNLSPSVSLSTLKDKSTKLKMNQIDRDIKRTNETKITKRETSEVKVPKIENQSQKQETKTKKTSDLENKKVDNAKEYSKTMIDLKESKKNEKDIKDMKKESKKDSQKESEVKKFEMIKTNEEDKNIVNKELKRKIERKKQDPKDSKELKVTPPVGKIENKSETTNKKMKISTSKKPLTGFPIKPEVLKTSTPKTTSKPSAKQMYPPAKSTKDANNRKVLEQKNIEKITSKQKASPPVTSVEKKPVVRRIKTNSSPSKNRLPGSPMKVAKVTATVSTKLEKDTIQKKIKNEKEAADSSTVSTSSVIDMDSMKFVDKCLTEKSEDMSLDSIENKVLADLKEERQVVEEIEAVLQKAERIENTRDNLIKDKHGISEDTVKKCEDLTEDDVTVEMDEIPRKSISRKASQELTEEDEYLIIEKEEMYTEDSVHSGETEHKHFLDVVQTEKNVVHDSLTKEIEDQEIIRNDKEDDNNDDDDDDNYPSDYVGNEGYIDDDDNDDADDDDIDDEDEDVEDEEDGGDDDNALKKEKEDDKDEKKREINKVDSVDNEYHKGTEKDTVIEKGIVEEQEKSDKKLHDDSEIEKKEQRSTSISISKDKEVQEEKIKGVISATTDINLKTSTDKELVETDSEIINKEPLSFSLEKLNLEKKAKIDTDSRPEIGKETQIREKFEESQERVSTLESGATTTAPTLPEDERISIEGMKPTPLEIVKQGMSEDIKKIETFAKSKTIPLAPIEVPELKLANKGLITQQPIPALPRDIVKTPDEVADLPVHEEVDPKLYEIDNYDTSKEDKNQYTKESVITSKEQKNFTEVFSKPTEKGIDKITESIRRDSEKDIDEKLFSKSGSPKKSFDVDELLSERKTEKDHQSIQYEEQVDTTKTMGPTKEDKEIDIPETILTKQEIKLDIHSIQIGDLDENVESVEDVEALLEEASKKFKTVKDSLRDSLESLEEHIVEEELKKTALELDNNNEIEGKLNKVAEKLEEIEPREENITTDITAPNMKSDVLQTDSSDYIERSDAISPVKNIKDAVKDVGEVLAGTAGIIIDDKPKDVIDIVKKVAEVLKEDDFLPVQDKSKTEVEKDSKDKKLSPDHHDEVLDTSSSIKSRSDSITEAKLMCAELLKENVVPHFQGSALTEDIKNSEVDVLEVGIEKVCEKVNTNLQKDDLHQTLSDVVTSEIAFDHKMIPTTAEVVLITPDSMPPSPKLSMEFQEETSVSEDVKNIIKNKDNIYDIIEDILLIEKSKISDQVLEFISINKHIPKQELIIIIEQIISKENLLQGKVDEASKMSEVEKETFDDIKKHQLEDYIQETYLTKNIPITLEILEEIALKQSYPKYLIIEIIESIIDMKKITKSSVFNISEKTLEQLAQENVLTRDVIADQESSVDDKARDDIQYDEIAQIPDEVMSEINDSISKEFIEKKKIIDINVIDRIHQQYFISKRIIIEIINNLIINKKLRKQSIVDSAIWDSYESTDETDEISKIVEKDEIVKKVVSDSSKDSSDRSEKGSPIEGVDEIELDDGRETECKDKKEEAIEDPEKKDKKLDIESDIKLAKSSLASLETTTLSEKILTSDLKEESFSTKEQEEAKDEKLKTEAVQDVIISQSITPSMEDHSIESELSRKDDEKSIHTIDTSLIKTDKSLDFDKSEIPDIELSLSRKHSITKDHQAFIKGEKDDDKVSDTQTDNVSIIPEALSTETEVRSEVSDEESNKVLKDSLVYNATVISDKSENLEKHPTTETNLIDSSSLQELMTSTQDKYPVDSEENVQHLLESHKTPALAESGEKIGSDKYQEEAKLQTFSKSSSPTADKSLTEHGGDELEKLIISTKVQTSAVLEKIESSSATAGSEYETVAPQQDTSDPQKRSSIDRGKEDKIQKKGSVPSAETDSVGIKDITDQTEGEKKGIKPLTLSRSPSNESLSEHSGDRTKNVTTSANLQSSAVPKTTESSSLIPENKHDDVETTALQQEITCTLIEKSVEQGEKTEIQQKVFKMTTDISASSIGTADNITDQIERQSKEVESPIDSKSPSPTSDKNLTEIHGEKSNDRTISTKYQPSADSEKVDSSSPVAEDNLDDIKTTASQQDITAHQKRSSIDQDKEGEAQRKDSVASIDTAFSDIKVTTDKTEKECTEVKLPTISKSPSPTSDKSITESHEDESKDLSISSKIQPSAVPEKVESSSPVAEDEHDDIKIAGVHQETIFAQKRSSIDLGEEVEVQRKDSVLSIQSGFSDIKDTTDETENESTEVKLPTLSKSPLPTSDKSVIEHHEDELKDPTISAKIQLSEVAKTAEGSIPVAEDKHDDIKTATLQQDITPLQKRSSINEGKDVEVQRKESVASIDTASSDIKVTTDKTEKESTEVKLPTLSKSPSSTSDKSITEHYEDESKDLTISAKIQPSAVPEKLESSSLVAEDEHDDIKIAEVHQETIFAQIKSSIDLGEDVEVQRKDSVLSIHSAFSDIKDTTDETENESTEVKLPTLSKSPSPTSDKNVTEHHEDESKDLTIFAKIQLSEVAKTAEGSIPVAEDKHDDIKTATLQQDITPIQKRSSINEGKDLEVQRKESVALIDTASSDIQVTTDKTAKESTEVKLPTISKSPSSTSDKSITESHEDESKDLSISSKIQPSAVPEKVESSSPVAEDEHDDIKIAGVYQDITFAQKRSSIDLGEEIEVQRKDSVLSIQSGFSDIKDTTDETENESTEVKLPTLTKSPLPTSDNSVTEHHEDELKDPTISAKIQLSEVSKTAEGPIPVAEDKHDDIKTATLQQDITPLQKRSSVNEDKDVEVQRKESVASIDTASSDIKVIIDQTEKESTDVKLPTLSKSSSPTSDKSITKHYEDESKDLTMSAKIQPSAVSDKVESSSAVAEDKLDGVSIAVLHQDITPVQKRTSIDQDKEVEVQRKVSVVLVDTASSDINDTTDQTKEQSGEVKLLTLSKSPSPTSDISATEDHGDESKDLVISTKVQPSAVPEKAASSSPVAEDKCDYTKIAAVHQDITFAQKRSSIDLGEKVEVQRKDSVVLIDKAAIDSKDIADYRQKQNEEVKLLTLSKSPSPTSDKSVTEQHGDESKDLTIPEQVQPSAFPETIEISSVITEDKHDDIKTSAFQHDVPSAYKRSSIDQGKEVEIQQKGSAVSIDTASVAIDETTDKFELQSEGVTSPIFSKSLSLASDQNLTKYLNGESGDLKIPTKLQASAVPETIKESTVIAEVKHDDIKMPAQQQDITFAQKRSSIDHGEEVEVQRKNSVASIDTASSDIKNTTDQTKKQSEDLKLLTLSKSPSPTSEKSVIEHYEDESKDLQISVKIQPSAVSETVESSSPVAKDEHDDAKTAALQQDIIPDQKRSPVDEGKEVEVQRKESVTSINTAFSDIKDTSDQTEKESKDAIPLTLSKSPTSDKRLADHLVDEPEDLTTFTKVQTSTVSENIESSSAVARGTHDDIVTAALQHDASLPQKRSSIDQGKEVEVHKKGSVASIDTASVGIEYSTDQSEVQSKEVTSPILSKSLSPTPDHSLMERHGDETEDLTIPTEPQSSAIPDKTERSSPVAESKHDDIKTAALQEDTTFAQKRSSIDHCEDVEVQKKDSVASIETGSSDTKDTTDQNKEQSEEVKSPIYSKSPSPTSDKSLADHRIGESEDLKVPTKLQACALPEKVESSSPVAEEKHDDIKTAALQQNITSAQEKMLIDEGKEAEIQKELLRSDGSLAEHSADVSHLKSPISAQFSVMLDKTGSIGQIVGDKDNEKENTVDQQDDIEIFDKEFTPSIETIVRESKTTTETMEDQNEAEKLDNLSIPSSSKSDKSSIVCSEADTKGLKLSVTLPSVVSEKALISSQVVCDMDDRIGIITQEQDSMISHKDKLIDTRKKQYIDAKEFISPIDMTSSGIQSFIDQTNDKCEGEQPKSPSMSASSRGDGSPTDLSDHGTIDPKLVTTSDQTKNISQTIEMRKDDIGITSIHQDIKLTEQKSSIDEKQTEQSHGEEFEFSIISEERKRSKGQLELCGDDKSITSRISISPCSDISIAEENEIDSKDVKLSSSLQSLVELDEQRSSSQKDDFAYSQDQKEQYNKKSPSSGSPVSNEKSSFTYPKEDQIQNIESTHLSILLSDTKVLADEKKDELKDQKSLPALESSTVPDHVEFESKLKGDLVEDAESTKVPTSTQMSQNEIPVDNITEEQQLCVKKPLSLNVIASSEEKKSLDKNLEDDKDIIQSEPTEEDSIIDQANACINLKTETRSKPMSSSSDQTVDNDYDNQFDVLKSSSATQSPVLTEENRNLIKEVKDGKYIVGEDILKGQKGGLEEVSLASISEISVPSDKPQNLSENVDIQDTVKIIVSPTDSTVQKENLLDREDEFHHDRDYMHSTSPVVSPQSILTDQILEKEGEEKVIASSSPQKEDLEASTEIIEDLNKSITSPSHSTSSETKSPINQTKELIKSFETKTLDEDKSEKVQFYSSAKSSYGAADEVTDKSSVLSPQSQKKTVVDKVEDQSKNLIKDGNDKFDSHCEIETSSEVLKTEDLLNKKLDKEKISKTPKTIIAETDRFTEKMIESGEDSQPSQSNRAESSYDGKDELTSVSSKDVDEKLADPNNPTIELDEFNDERKYMLTKKNDIENYIMSQYVIKGRKIVSDNLEEIVNLYNVSKDIVVEIIEEICNKKNIEMEFIFDEDKNIKFNTEYIVTKKEIQPTELIMDKKVDVENSEFLIKNKEQEEKLRKQYEFYDKMEKRCITEKKLMEVESKIQEKYINENNKISWSDLDEMEKTLSVPRYILIEIIEKLIIKMHLSRKSIYDQIILDESDDGNELLERQSCKPVTECQSFECSTSQVLDHDNKYESQFQISFPSTITEMRTTHITTFSEKSSEDLHSDPSHFVDYPESPSRLTATALETKNIEKSIISDRDIEQETAKKMCTSVDGETKTVEEMPEYDVIIKRTVIKSSLVEPEMKNENESKTAVTRKEPALETREKYETDETKQIESKEKVYSYKSHLGMITSEEKSGRSTPERKDGFDSCSRTATPEGFRSEEVIRTTITTTRTISNEGEIVTTTKEVTETTNEHGQTIVLAEKVDVMVADQGSSVTKLASVETDHSSESQKLDSSCLGLQTSSSDPHDNNDGLLTHVWPKCEETSPKSETIETPTSISSQVYHCEMQGKPVEFSAADMSSSFYGQLPSIPPSHEMESSITFVSSNDGDDFTFKKVTTYDVLSDDMKLHQAANIEKDDESEQVDKVDEEKSGDAAKDLLKDWGKPMKLPPPERPDRFNFGNNSLSRSINIPSNSVDFDILHDWGKPMELPSPAFGGAESSDKTSSSTPRKDNKQSKKIISENFKNKKHSESPSKSNKKSKEINNKIQPIYLDLTFVPHHGNSYYTSFEFFKQIRARYYVFSGTEPSRDVYDALLNAKKTWENKDLEVTIIPTYDTDTLGYWVADNEEALAENHIDLSPSASRCTINLQDHETSCSAYRLEF